MCRDGSSLLYIRVCIWDIWPKNPLMKCSGARKLRLHLRVIVYRPSPEPPLSLAFLLFGMQTSTFSCYFVRREATTIPDSLNARGLHIDTAKSDIHIPFNYDYVSVLNQSAGFDPSIFRPINVRNGSDFL